MSRTRIVGGSITKVIGGDYSIYSEDGIEYKGKKVSFRSDEGIVFGEYESPEIEEEIIQITEEPYKCLHCEEEITKEQIKKSIGGNVSSKRIENINKILPYINKYRKDFGLDSCLKKAHFIAQVIHESNRFFTFEEYEKWSYWNNNKNKPNSLPGIFSNNKVKFDEVMGNSLKDHLSEIFKITDSEDNLISKTNEEIMTLLLNEEVEVVDKKLYTNYHEGEELLKEVKEKVINKDGTVKEKVKYKIYLKNHSHFGIPLLSRMYAPYSGDNRGLGNGDELSRDGWKYKGRGLKQLTGRSNYDSFTEYRNKVNFPEDDTGEIDFAINEDENTPQYLKNGNYVKVAEPMYAVQSSLYFWNEGTKYMGKYAVEHAEKDNVLSVSKAINLYDTGSFSIRESYYNKSRKKDAFDIVRHYKDLYDNGNESQKEDALAYFEKWKDNDDEAKKILDEINGTDEQESTK